MAKVIKTDAEGKPCTNPVKDTIPGRNGGTLTPFKPGNNMNPNGRPKNRPIAAAIRELLDADEGSKLKKIAQVAVDNASDGDFRFAKEIMERIDGKVVDEVHLSGRVDGTITQERFEDMNDESRNRLLRSAGITDVDIESIRADQGPVDAGPG